MKKSNALVSTAMLTALFEEKKKDNISLISPFVLNIINKDKTIDYEGIAKEMEEDYSFSDFPQAIVRIIINRLTREKQITKSDKIYKLSKKAEKIVDEFVNRKEKAKKEIDDIIHSLEDYFEKSVHMKMNYEECKNALSSFLSKNGYLLYENMNNSSRLIKNSDKINYNIGCFIQYSKEQNGAIFEYLKDIIEGSLLANALYVNIENSNSRDLSNLTCYFDTPFMLRVLEFKTPESNKSALELVNLLKKKKAKIKCFKHNFEEIENIIEEYIKNIHKEQDRTLENFKIKDLNETQVLEILNNLNELFDEKGIEIVEVPDYKKEEYKNVIDEKKLMENIKKAYNDANVSKRMIENDVKSISAIVRLRKGKDYRKLEECPAIFVTTNMHIKIETNKLLNLDETFKISPAISDIDLTAIVWLKSLSYNKDIPEIKLTENALAAIKPNDNIRRKFNKIIKDKEENNGIFLQSTNIESLLYNEYYQAELLSRTGGDIEKVNTKNIVSTYEDAIKKSKKLEQGNMELEEKNKNLIASLKEKENSLKEIRERIYEKHERKEEKVKRIILIAERTIPVVICSLLTVIDIILSNNNNFKDNKLLIFFSLLNIYAIIATFLPFSIFSLLKKITEKINQRLFPYLKEKTNSKAEKEIKSLLFYEE